MADKSTRFFRDEAAIVAAIHDAELQTSGEIRVHLEDHCAFDVIGRAEEIFFELGMHKTQLSNGVLIYIAVADHKMAIIGDKGMDAVVGVGFWEQEIATLQRHFSQGKTDEGIIAVIHDIGQKLKTHFPSNPHHNDNELTNEISFG
jgi:uncharacterized membrane protein